MATQTLHCLYIPDDLSLNQHAEERTLLFPKTDFDDVLCKLLECKFSDLEIIYSDDILAMLNGSENGLPHGQSFTQYEVYMDDNGNATRPHNSLAARLLGRPKSHGPMIVIKLTFTKLKNGEIQIVSNDPMTQGELESATFKRKREEFSTKKAAHDRSMVEMLRRRGDIVINLT